MVLTEGFEPSLSTLKGWRLSHLVHVSIIRGWGESRTHLGGTISHEPVVSSLRLGSRQPYSNFLYVIKKLRKVSSTTFFIHLLYAWVERRPFLDYIHIIPLLR